MNHAYVSMMTGGDAYLPGLETLRRSLLESGTTVPCVVMVDDEVSPDARAALIAAGWQVRPIEPVASPDADSLMPRFDATYSKLRAFDLTEFDKVVFLDGDTVVVQNIDDLFDRPALAAAPDFLLPDRFNSGVMVIEPSAQEFSRLVGLLATTPSYDGGDQGFLNEVYDWYAMEPSHRLATGYNTHHFVFQFIAAHPVLREHALPKIRIVHYTVQKPWQAFVLTGGAGLWEGFNERAHAEHRSHWRQRLRAVQDWSFETVIKAMVG